MSKNVCMFVWNNFTNDARVLRECTALSEEGYKVDLICIHDPNDEEMKYVEKRNENFNIYRVRRYPVLFSIIQTSYRYCLDYKIAGGISFIIWLFLAYYFPVVILPLTIMGLLILKTKAKTVFVRGSIITRMIIKGRKKKYDLYHSNDLNTLPQGYICSKWRLKRKPLIYDSHEVQTSRTGYDSPIYGKMERFFIKRIDSMIVENHTRAKYNEDLYGFYPNVVHNYPFLESVISNEKVNLHEMLHLPTDEKILLYQGGIQAGRGLEQLIHAVPKFKEGTLVLIGDGRIKPDLVKMVKEMDFQEKVRFIPKVPLSELPRYTRNAYLGFQVLNNTNFNHYSASSNKLFEYMMAEVPVVACDFPEIKRVVEGENTGICIDSHDPKAIADAVNRLLEDRKLRNQLSDNSLKASVIFNWEREKEMFMNVYTKSILSDLETIEPTMSN
ncbi:glycosyltransferase family 4 protein [Viridibacillus sp. YIM B01967]|uniref:Glycosyltransferase family 4 protein n=1 Tax=Viridibacillus soli TaxID=2798301 RepID=A0ABS1H3Y6_9BACL|nr:glycosyltransferase family 4 protein [Viridibacillus soli]MBK3493773.1 glycosyltransferase family 4 protein [Viridibacillus soli]